MSTNLLTLPVVERVSPLYHWNRFLDSKTSPKTRASYSYRIHSACEYAGFENELRFIPAFENDPTGIAYMIRNAMQSAGKGEWQRKPILSTLANYGRWLWEQGIIETKPQIESGKKRNEWVDRLETVTEPEIHLISDWIKAQPEPIQPLHNAVLEGLYYRGLRRMELLSIRRCDIDREHNRVSITEKFHAEDYNAIPVSQRFIERLTALEAAILTIEPNATSEQYLFIPPDTFATRFIRRHHIGGINKMNDATLNRIVETWGEGIGVNLHPHMFRHGIATRLVAMGKGVREVAAFLRQSSQIVQEKYFDSLETTARAVLDSL